MSLFYKHIRCPQCGHSLDLQLDENGETQDFYEDCPNCCKAFHVRLTDIGVTHCQVIVDADDEQIY